MVRIPIVTLNKWIERQRQGDSMKNSARFRRMCHCMDMTTHKKIGQGFDLLVLAPSEGTVWHGPHVLYLVRTRCNLWVLKSYRGPDLNVWDRLESRAIISNPPAKYLQLPTYLLVLDLCSRASVAVLVRCQDCSTHFGSCHVD